MYSIIAGSLLISILHAVIPNHWLPVLAIGRKHNWSLQEVTQVTFISGLAHALSTIVIGVIVGLLGSQLANKIDYFTHFIAPAILLVLGIFFIYQHHRHKHFHLHKTPQPTLAGTRGLWFVFLIAALYLLISVSGMVLWVRLAYNGLLKLNWHTLEHNSGIITGWTLVITGIISFFIS